MKVCAILVMIIILASACSVNETAEKNGAVSDEPSVTVSNETILYNGARVVDSEDFEVFEKYFYGNWVDESGTAPEAVELYYSGNTFSFGFCTLTDIYTDENSAYLAIELSGETTIYVVDFNEPEIMKEYAEANHGGRAKNNPDFTYAKKSADEDDSLGFFGILKLHYVDNIPLDAVMGNTFELSDNSKWCNFGERLSVVEKTADKIVFKALCRAEGDNPYMIDIIDSADEPMKSREIVFEIIRSGDDWTVGQIIE